MFLLFAKLFLPLFLFLLTFCSANRDFTETPHSSRSKNEATSSLITPLDVSIPQWLLSIPENSVIGISKISPNTDEMVLSSREMAAVQFARNLGSYNVQKYVQYNRVYNSIEYNDTYGFDFQVADTTGLRKIFTHLHLTSHLLLHNTYFIALYDYDENSVCEKSDLSLSVPADNVFSSLATEKPEWYHERGVYPKDGSLYCYSEATSSCLLDAWSKAAQRAGLKIASYHSANVDAFALVRDKESEQLSRQFVALETLYLLTGTRLTRSFINSYYSNNNLIYKVYLQVVAQ